MPKMKLAVLLVVFTLALGVGTVAARNLITLTPIAIGPQCVIVERQDIPNVQVCLNGECVPVPDDVDASKDTVCATLVCSATSVGVTVSPGATDGCPAGSMPILAFTVDIAAGGSCTLSASMDSDNVEPLTTPPLPDPEPVEVCIATGP